MFSLLFEGVANGGRLGPTSTKLGKQICVGPSATAKSQPHLDEVWSTCTMRLETIVYPPKAITSVVVEGSSSTHSAISMCTRSGLPKTCSNPSTCAV